jgi:RecJ-like exonuclease
MNQSKEPVNLSSRGMWTQLDKGIDLAAAMREACAASGGEGGGHRIAAGGSIPSENVSRFLETLDTILERQLSSSK